MDFPQTDCEGPFLTPHLSRILELKRSRIGDQHEEFFLMVDYKTRRLLMSKRLIDSQRLHTARPPSFFLPHLI